MTLLSRKAVVPPVILVLLAVFVRLSGAVHAETVLTDVWKDNSHAGPATKVAVFWMSPVSQNRLLAENEFVRQLKERGIMAIPVYVVIPPDKLVGRDAAVAKIRDLGADVLITLRATDRQTAQTTIPAPGSPDSSRMSGYYSSVYDAPAGGTAGMAYVESNLFSVGTEQRIWSARSVTKVDVVDHKALADFIKVLVDRLAADRMIP